MRDLLVFGTVVLALPIAFRRPYLGLLLFSWLAYMRPQDLCWTFARDMRFSFFAGATMLAGWFVYESGRRPFARWEFRTVLMVALAALVTLSFALARTHGEYQMRYYVEFLKIILVALFTTGQVNTRERLRWILWTIALCLAFYGVKGGLFGVLTGGAPIIRGPGGMLEDNNDFALALVMNIPQLFHLGRSEKIPWVKTATNVGVLLTMVTILLTHSRGAFVALVATLLWMAWISGRLFQAMGTLGVLAVLFLAFAPANVLDRLATISQGAEESSAAARLRSWSVAFRMIEDHPVMGVGLRNFQEHFVEYSDTPGINEENATTHVAHNSYLQIWAEAGTPAFFVYLALLASVFVAGWRVRHLARAGPHMQWAGHYSRMLEASMVGFMVGAIFLNRGHFDLIYHFLDLVTCLSLVAYGAFREAPMREREKSGEIQLQWRPTVAGARHAVRWENLS